MNKLDYECFRFIWEYKGRGGERKGCREAGAQLQKFLLVFIHDTVATDSVLRLISSPSLYNFPEIEDDADDQRTKMIVPPDAGTLKYAIASVSPGSNRSDPYNRGLPSNS